MIRRSSRRFSNFGLLGGILTLLLLLSLIWLRSAWVPLVQDFSSPLLSKLQPLMETLPALKTEWQLYRQTALNQKAVLSELAQLRKQQQAMEIVAAENQRLRSLLNLPTPKGYLKIGAEVIARSPNQWTSRLQINKGFEDGLSINRIVLNQEGVVGKISELSARTAMVELLTDQNSAVACITEKDRRPAILNGAFPGEPAKLKYLENYTKVVPGEKILTSGLGGNFPPDLLLGTVTEVKQDPGHPVPEVFVKLSAFNQALQYLVVLVPEP